MMSALRQMLPRLGPVARLNAIRVVSISNPSPNGSICLRLAVVAFGRAGSSLTDATRKGRRQYGRGNREEMEEAKDIPVEVPLADHACDRDPGDPAEDAPHPDPEPNDEEDERRGFGLEVVDVRSLRTKITSPKMSQSVAGGAREACVDVR